MQLHARYVTGGVQQPSPWSQLVKHYLSLGCRREALILYAHSLPSRPHSRSLLPLILKACASLPSLPLGQSLHAESIKAGLARDLLVGTTLVSMYSKCRRSASARVVFDEMPCRNAVTHNAMIGGYAADGDMESASRLFEMTPVRTPVTWTAMIEGFAGAGDTAAARRVFDGTPPGMRNVVTWTVMVHGYAANGEMDLAREFLDRMPSRNAFVWSSMITGYFKKGHADEARKVFDRVPVRNLVIWNVLVAGYAQIGRCEEAMEAYRQMQEQGFEPDEFTMASVLSACSQLGSLEAGREIHELIHRKRIKMNQFVSSGLLDMYAKCGDLEQARRIFYGMSRRNDSCWNAMISGLASHGHSEEALDLFSQMEQSGEKPNAITFLTVLSACTHGGLVDRGLEIFAQMDEYGVVPAVQHYGCLVDLLGRAGRLAEAYDTIKRMPMRPNEVVWGALLGACKLHANREMVNRVMGDVGDLNSSSESSDDAPYVVLANIYAASEKWEEAQRVRRLMMENGIQKTPGCSSVSVGNTEHRFHAGALLESQALELYGT